MSASKRLLCSSVLASLRDLPISNGALQPAHASFTRAQHSGFVSVLSNSFSRDPAAASNVLADQLTPAQRAILLAALDSKAASTTTQTTSSQRAYSAELFSAADMVEPKGTLNRAEFEQALAAHIHHSRTMNRSPPTWLALVLVFTVSAIPFVAFGFLDNGIMIVAGEKIDHYFGAKLGLSTLASAGLGNLVADVTGVGAAGFIEEGVKKISFIKPPPLSSAQRALRSVQAARFSGALVGVAIGCLLGLTPLLAMDSFFVKTAA